MDKSLVPTPLVWLILSLCCGIGIECPQCKSTSTNTTDYNLHLRYPKAKPCLAMHYSLFGMHTLDMRKEALLFRLNHIRAHEPEKLKEFGSSRPLPENLPSLTEVNKRLKKPKKEKKVAQSVKQQKPGVENFLQIVQHEEQANVKGNVNQQASAAQ